MFAIVGFVDEDSVEWVPSSWMIGKTICCWPNASRTRIHQLRLTATQPADDWERHTVKFYGTAGTVLWILRGRPNCNGIAALFLLARATTPSRIDSIEDARKKAIRAEETSDLATDEEIGRHRHPPNYYVHAGVSNSTMEIPEKRRKLQTADASHRSTVFNAYEFSGHMEKAAADVQGKYCKGCFASLCTEVATLKEETAGLRAEIQAQRQMLTEFLQRQTAADTSDDAFHLPISSMQLFDAFLNQLEDATQLRSLIKYLGLCGGDSVTTIVARILRQLLTHDLSLKFNLYGRGQSGRRGISGTKLMEAIIGAVRLNGRTQKATNAEVEAAVKNWLRNAADRHGGRRARLSVCAGQKL